jgi:hypothetical protein
MLTWSRYRLTVHTKGSIRCVVLAVQLVSKTGNIDGRPSTVLHRLADVSGGSVSQLSVSWTSIALVGVSESTNR